MKYKNIKLSGLDQNNEFEKDLIRGVGELAEATGLKLSGAKNSVTVNAKKGSCLSVKLEGGKIELVYPSKVGFFRALSFVPAVIGGGDAVYEEATRADDMLCYMGDMSRNAVYNLPSAKRMIRYLALMGYTSLMLYTEDTYEIPEYPYFGHMRGRFTKEELKEIDDYAFMFGIEVIPCVQALAHLTTALRWPDFRGYKDTDDILMVGNEKTYKFVEAILKTCRECFRSDRINLGMDEAHMLGRGNYLTQHGYRPAPELMLEHLDRVVALCEQYNYHPMIWSDMFFRMAFGGAYRVSEGEIPPEIIARVPKNLTLIYWDYYSLDSGIFTHMVDCHLKFNNPIAFAGGAWKWYGFAPHNRFSIVSTEMQLDVCRDKGIKNMIVTAWGDNGAEASQFVPLPVLLYFAEHEYAGRKDNEWLEKRAMECFGIGYEALLTLDSPNELEGITLEAGRPLNPSRYLLFNDPLEGLMDMHLDPEHAPADFAKNAEKLRQYVKNKDFGYMYDTLAALCDLLAIKCDFSIRLRKAYLAKDNEALAKINAEIPEIIKRLDTFTKKLRFQWYHENKTFGLTNTELRLGGLKERLNSVKLRIDGYLNGKYEKIEELEQPVLSISGKKEPEYISYQSWLLNSTVGVM